MKKTHLLKLTVIFSVLIMLTSFAIIPDEYPWYSEVLLFNIGLWSWLLAKNELKKIQSPLGSN
ncbi:MAG: hypothetical protein AB7H97_07330 [Pseudobdellovibrionaceae bacterium]